MAASPLYLEKHQPTGWERVDRALEEMKARLDAADNEEKFQAIGMIGRETLITVAQQVFDSARHPTLDGVESSPTDAKRMLDAYLQYELADNSEKMRKFAKAAVDLGNQLTHDRNATKRDASICLVSEWLWLLLLKQYRKPKTIKNRAFYSFELERQHVWLKGKWCKLIS